VRFIVSLLIFNLGAQISKIYCLNINLTIKTKYYSDIDTKNI